MCKAKQSVWGWIRVSEAEKKGQTGYSSEISEAIGAS